MVSSATVVGIEKHLTTPSRHYPKRRDIWVAAEWAERGGVWEQAFEEVARRTSLSSGAILGIELYPLSLTRGWIVARGVDMTIISTDDVERVVRDVASQTNASAEERNTRPATAERKSGPRWSVRSRDGLLTLLVGLARTHT